MLQLLAHLATASAATTRIAVLGGAFNPITNAHVQLASENQTDRPTLQVGKLRKNLFNLDLGDVVGAVHIVRRVQVVELEAQRVPLPVRHQRQRTEGGVIVPLHQRSSHLPGRQRALLALHVRVARRDIHAVVVHQPVTMRRGGPQPLVCLEVLLCPQPLTTNVLLAQT